jgi:hypothetical protein
MPTLLTYDKIIAAIVGAIIAGIFAWINSDRQIRKQRRMNRELQSEVERNRREFEEYRLRSQRLWEAWLPLSQVFSEALTLGGLKELHNHPERYEEFYHNWEDQFKLFSTRVDQETASQIEGVMYTYVRDCERLAHGSESIETLMRNRLEVRNQLANIIQSHL